MKTQKIWALNPYDQKLKATWGGDGKLRMSDDLFTILPEYIQVSFVPDLRELHISVSTEEEGGFKKHKAMCVPKLVCYFFQEGLSAPIGFRFSTGDKNEKWIGRSYISKKRKDFAAQFLILKKHMVRSLVYTKAKSTPCRERWQTANIALLEASQKLSPSLDEFDDFAKLLIVKRLKEENSGYVKSAAMKSLDAGKRNYEGDTWCLYDIIDSTADVSRQAEENLLYEDFDRKSKTLTKMLLTGCKLHQIADELSVSEEDVFKIARRMREMQMS